jgi:hypothetical protein
MLVSNASFFTSPDLAKRCGDWYSRHTQPGLGFSASAD